MAQNAKRLKRQETDKRALIKLNSSIKEDGVNGVMMFGEDNDYPQMMELVINGSPTAKSAASTYSKFLAGEGFSNESINNIIVGKDQRGKDITLQGLLRQTCDSIAKNNGAYIHRNTNLNGVTGTVHLKPFKFCRFAKPDDRGYSAKIGVHSNWEKDNDNGRFNKNDIRWYPVYTNNKKAIESQFKAAGGVDKFKGQIYFLFLDNEYFYPLSPFDSTYLDCDTEQQLALYKNRQLRNGFFDKIVARVQPGIETTDQEGNKIEGNSIADDLVEFLGADGETVFVFEDDINPDTQEFYKNSFQLENVKGNVDSKLFENWEKGLANNIRKSPRNLPNLLIEISDGIFSGQSGEAIKQATAFYNAMTRDDRQLISESFKEIFKDSEIQALKDNNDWTIKELTLIKEDGNTIIEPSSTTSN